MSTAAAAVRSPDQVNAELPYRFEVVPLKYLMVDAYQRPLTSFVDRIEKNYDPALLGTLVVSERSRTKFALIDGQTRAEGMKRKGETNAPCIVFTGLTVAQEAELFARLQMERRGMHSAHRFNAQVIAGHETQVAIKQLVEAEGFKIGTNDSKQDDRTSIQAVAALEYVYYGAQTGRAKKPDPDLLSWTLEVIMQVWPKLPEGARGALIIRGLGYFLKQHRETLDQERLVQRLQRLQPSELGKRAQALKEGKGMTTNSPAFMAEAIANQYQRR